MNAAREEWARIMAEDEARRTEGYLNCHVHCICLGKEVVVMALSGETARLFVVRCLHLGTVL